MALKDRPVVSISVGGGSHFEKFMVGVDTGGTLTLELEMDANTDSVTAKPKHQDPGLRDREVANGFTICRGTFTTLTGFTAASIGISDLSDELGVCEALRRCFEFTYTFGRRSTWRTAGY